MVLQSEGQTYEGIATVFNEVHQDAQANAAAQPRSALCNRPLVRWRAWQYKSQGVSADGQNVSLVVINALTSGRGILTGTTWCATSPWML